MPKIQTGSTAAAETDPIAGAITGIVKADGAGNISAADATDMPVDPTGLIVLTATDLQTAFEQTDAALVNARSTGLRNGGAISDQGSGIVRIAAGHGSVLDNTDPVNPTYCACTFVQTDIDLSALNGINYIYVDDMGAVLSTTVAPTSESRRLYIYLWRVSVIGGLFSAATSICTPLQQYGQNTADAFEALGLVRSGLVTSPAATDLTLAVSAGVIYQSGANFHVNPADPNKTNYTLKSPATFRLFTQNNTQGSDRTTLDVANYDLAGTVTAIPGAATRAQIWTVLQFPSTVGEIRIAYGQSYYSSVSDAVAALQGGLYSPVIPSQKSGAIIIGYIITAANATNLADGVQTFITTNRFGLLGGAIASVGATPLLAANNLSDLASASTARTNIGLGSLATQSDDLSLLQPKPSEGAFANGDKTKLDGIQANALASAAVEALIASELADSPTLVSPALGTPASGNLANCTGYPKKIAIIADQKAQNTNGGTFTAGAWRTRDLNTEIVDTDGIVSISANQFTLQAGTYKIHAIVNAFGVARHMAKLYNVTDTADVQFSQSGYATNSYDGIDRTHIVGQFTIASAKEFEIRHWGEVTKTTYGFGLATNFAVETYLVIYLEKIA